MVEDGAAPYAGLALAEDTLYGTTAAGGNYGNGTLFSLKTDGTAFTNLHSFAASYCDRERCWNSDGVVPQALLTVSGGKVYGTASLGGPSGNGTMFAMNTDGTEFTMIHQFTELIRNGWYGPFFNSDGTYPVGGLVLSGKILYGTATFGGTSDQGTVFAIGIDGTGFTALHSFSESVINTTINSDGAAPFASLILSGNVLYGTTFSGGEWGKGTLFSLSLPPPISISCPAPLILECTSGRARGTIEINVQSSRASSLAIVWTIDSVPYQTNDLPSGSIPFSTNVTLSADFALGDHLVTVSAASGETESVTCSTTVQVRDTIPPVVLGISATPNLLWPPNHKMVPVAIEVQAIDNCGEPTSKIVAVASNEPLGSHNDKDGRDWVITGDLTAGLRAERLGSGQGRTYTIFVECRDAARNSSLSSVIIIVPAHN